MYYFLILLFDNGVRRPDGARIHFALATCRPHHSGPALRSRLRAPGAGGRSRCPCRLEGAPASSNALYEIESETVNGMAKSNANAAPIRDTASANVS